MAPKNVRYWDGEPLYIDVREFPIVCPICFHGVHSRVGLKPMGKGIVLMEPHDEHEIEDEDGNERTIPWHRHCMRCSGALIPQQIGLLTADWFEDIANPARVN